jgi:hypothetical protein
MEAVTMLLWDVLNNLLIGQNVDTEDLRVRVDLKMIPRCRSSTASQFDDEGTRGWVCDRRRGQARDFVSSGRRCDKLDRCTETAVESRVDGSGE